MIKMHYVFQFYYKFDAVMQYPINRSFFFFELLDVRCTFYVGFVEIVVNLIHIKIYYAEEIALRKNIISSEF